MADVQSTGASKPCNGFECLTVDDVDTNLESVFNYFGNNVTKLMIYVGRYMDQRPNFGANAVQSKQSGSLYGDLRFWRGGVSGREFLKSVESGSLQEEKEIALKEAELSEMQTIRRRASVIGLKEKITKERITSGRKTTNAEETNIIVQEAIKLAKQEEEEEAQLGFEDSKEDEELPEEEKNWKYLPYVAVSGSEVDEALAEQLNIYEIDVDIKRLSKKRKKKGKTKDIYRIKDKKYIVRYIHGVLLSRELTGGKSTFEELIPLLRKVAGIPGSS